jgi:hypothetical protein
MRLERNAKQKSNNQWIEQEERRNGGKHKGFFTSYQHLSLTWSYSVPLVQSGG